MHLNIPQFHINLSSQHFHINLTLIPEIPKEADKGRICRWKGERRDLVIISHGERIKEEIISVIISNRKMEKKNDVYSNKYKFGQVFGTQESVEILDEDIISCLKFDPTGEYLCLGDKAGRIIVFKASNACTKGRPESEQYEYYAEFQSHNRQFDPLKGFEISEQIVGISWLKPQGPFLKLLTTNSKTIKFWKASEKTGKKLVKSANKQLSMPKLISEQPRFIATQQLAFPSLHSSEINSLSHSYNQQYILSSDDERSFLWNLERPTQPYIVNEIVNKSSAFSSQQSITCSKMHPKSDHLFAFGLNRNELGVCDMRQSPMTSRALQFGVEARSMKNFFTELISSVSSAQFLNNDRFIISREYLNVKIWDTANTKKPVANICIQDGLKSKLTQLFESDSIFDKFSLCSSQDSSTLITGNYNNCFHLIDTKCGVNTQYALNFKKITDSKPIVSGKVTPMSKLDTHHKTAVTAYHPINHSIAVASLNCFFIFNA